MSASSSDLLSALDALSPVDGRYRAASAPLRGLLAERGLIRERIRVEAQWLLHLAAAVPQLPGAQFTPAVRERARQLASAPEPAAAATVKAIEERINHDVKAVEYYVREQLAAVGAADATLELVHFGCTSEDINNLSYARLLHAARDTPLGGGEHSRQVEWRRRQLQRPRRGAAGGGLAGRIPGVRHLAVARVQPLDDPDRAARLDRRILRWARRHERGVHRSQPRLVGVHLARLSAPARPPRGGRFIDHASQGKPDRLRERGRQLWRGQCVAAALRREAAGVALAARSQRLDRAAQPGRRARAYADRLERARTGTFENRGRS